ncbi:YhcN/YlaJ family sporulation lipoprotein [Desulforamulus aquiferis]|uniref:YhcN/YlaJ family sporulation lipoprotein n=1 Tax=Desulforamulus aquiferis TaxID=1397668 RepID=A0AAW7Z7Y1_9FIRM|nr:YhcN/YlaJ family sporulation lipoprotein [Desulforamulus aquiferis]MDO7785637.1 YhcN/YlaJ family sporulation lipoprotein [Desulforamulus aquiferis]
MIISRKLMAIFLFVFLVTLIVGCTAARKPEPDANRNPAAQENQQAQTLAAEAARVEGVKEAYVVVSGNMALVGLSINRDVTDAETNRIKSEAGQRVQAADGQITDVRVSTDPDTVVRIRNIFNGIGQGRPLSSFETEITELVRRIAPTKEQ